MRSSYYLLFVVLG